MKIMFSEWDQVLSTDDTNRFCFALAAKMATRLESKAAREYITVHLDCHDVHALCNYGVTYHDSVNVNDASIIRGICALFEKRSDIDLGIDKRQTAVDTFILAERRCRVYNDLYGAVNVGDASLVSTELSAQLHEASRFISRVLGPVPKMEEINLRLGPGATTQIPKRKASAKRKLSMPFACSEDLLGVLRELLEELPHLVSRRDLCNDEFPSVSLVPVELHTGKLAFVPKTAKTDRSVVVEPWLNGKLQLGLGEHIARRLKLFGMPTEDQTRNREWARIGSLSGSLATIDLKSASDLISIELVRNLLPEDWFRMLSFARTSFVTYEGISVRQEKFSSMGNGFTFPLEMLIFWALAGSVCGFDQVTVYGDDIICPSEHYQSVTRLLDDAGFVVNTAKSFSSGPFRESCGADYLRGIDIRPCYLKGQLSGQDIFRLHNHFVKNGDAELANFCLNHIARPLRLYGLSGYGDGHLISDRSCLTPYRRENGWCGWVFDSFVFVGQRDFSCVDDDHALALYTAQNLGDENLPSLRELNANSLAGTSFSISERKRRPGLVYRGDSLGCSTPGVDGYKRVSIYVL